MPCFLFCKAHSGTNLPGLFSRGKALCLKVHAAKCAWIAIEGFEQQRYLAVECADLSKASEDLE